MTTATERFRSARDFLLAHREDYATAYEGFAWDWLDPHRRHVLITVAGEIDIATVPQLRGQLTLLAAGGRPVIADLTGVTFIDAAGLGVLAGAAAKAAASGGSLHVVSGRHQVRRIFALTGLDRQIPLARTLAEAVAGLRAGRDIRANGNQPQPGPPGPGWDRQPQAQRPHAKEVTADERVSQDPRRRPVRCPAQPERAGPRPRRRPAGQAGRLRGRPGRR